MKSRTIAGVSGLVLVLGAFGCTALLGDFSVDTAGGGAGADASVDGTTADALPPLRDAAVDATRDGPPMGCEAGAKECVGNRARTCVGGMWQVKPCADDRPICVAGDCALPPSCSTLLSACAGPKNCCSAPVAQGATFNRFNRAPFPATVSDVRLNQFEVTVARFRTFVAAGNGIAGNPPANGSGAHPKIPNSGWSAGLNASLQPSTAALETILKSCAGFPNATYAPAGVIASNNKPMNCVTYAEAFAFCIWDGGRLPTVAELELATRGGTEQRAFPWGAAPLDAAHAFYCSTQQNPCTAPDTAGGMQDVGSVPLGAGRFGHLDLFGSMREYTLDIYTPMPPACLDCAQLDTSAATSHGALGGSWSDVASSWPTIHNSSPTTSTNPRTSAGGFRCAYDL